MRRGRVQYHEAGTTRAEILIDAGVVAGRRIDPDYQWVEVELADARAPELALDFASEGLCFVVAPSCVHHPNAFTKLQAAYELELRTLLERLSGARIGVVITDTFGRPWRRGLVDVAIGVSGVRAIDDLRGTFDSHGNELNVTEVAVVDEIAAAADLVMGKATGIPAAVVRGLNYPGDGRATDLVRPAEEDMFR